MMPAYSLPPETITVSDPAIIAAVQLLESGNHIVVSWPDLQLLASLIFCGGMLAGYAIQKLYQYRQYRRLIHG